MLDAGANGDDERVESSDDEGEMIFDSSQSYEGKSSTKSLVLALLQLKSKRANDQRYSSHRSLRKPPFAETPLESRHYDIPVSFRHRVLC